MMRWRLLGVLLGVVCCGPAGPEEEEPAPPLEQGEPCDETDQCLEDLVCIDGNGNQPPESSGACRNPCEVDTVFPQDGWRQEPSSECPDADAPFCFRGQCQGPIDD